MISTRSVELVIDTVVCLTLAKWETVSGQFGGYFTPASGVVPQAERSNRNRNQHSNCNHRGVQQCQPDRQLALRKVDHLWGLQSCVPPEGTLPHQQVLAAAAVSDSPLATPVHAVRPRRACATAIAVCSTLRGSTTGNTRPTRLQSRL